MERRPTMSGGDGNSWTERPIDPAFDTAVAVCAGPTLDSDGDLDVLGNGPRIWNRCGGFGRTRPSTAAPTNPAKHVVASALDGAYTVTKADVDGDGDLDVVGTAIYRNTVALVGERWVS